MRITLLTVGRCRTAYLEEGATDYARRIGRYATLEQVVVKEERGQKGRLSEDITRKEGASAGCRSCKRVPCRAGSLGRSKHLG